MKARIFSFIFNTIFTVIFSVALAVLFIIHMLFFFVKIECVKRRDLMWLKENIKEKG